MASIEVDVVNFVLDTGTGTFSVSTRSGFGTPKGIIVFACGSVVTDDTAGTTADVDFSVGFSDGTNDCCTHVRANDGVGTTSTDRMQRNDACILAVNSSGVIQHQMSVSSFGTDSVVFSIDNQASIAARCTLIVFGGDDVDYIEVGTTQLGTSGASTTVSLSGARSTQPTLVLAIGSMNANINTFTTHGLWTFGAAVNAGAQAGLRYGNQSGEGTATAVFGNVSDSYATGQSFTAGNWNGAIDNFANDAFDINPDVSPGSDYVGWMSFQFTNSPGIKVGDVTYPASGSYAQSDVGFTPQAAIIASMSGPTARDTDTTTGARLAAVGMVAFDDTDIGAVTFNSDDGVGTTVEDTTHCDSFKLLAEDGTTTSLEGPTPTFDSAGWDSVLTTNPASDILGFYIAFEEADAAGGGGPAVFKNIGGGGLLGDGNFKMIG